MTVKEILKDIYLEIKSFAKKRNIGAVVRKDEVLYGEKPINVTKDFINRLKKAKKYRTVFCQDMAAVRISHGYASNCDCGCVYAASFCHELLLCLYQLQYDERFSQVHRTGQL